MAAFLAVILSFSPVFPFAPDLFLAFEESIRSAHETLAQKSDFAREGVNNLERFSFPALTFTDFQSAASLTDTLALFINGVHDAVSNVSRTSVAEHD
ncbi:MAG: hypothetical protein ACRD4B_02475, partial [Acidobacteriota bacterium]